MMVTKLCSIGSKCIKEFSNSARTCTTFIVSKFVTD